MQKRGVDMVDQGHTCARVRTRNGTGNGHRHRHTIDTRTVASHRARGATGLGACRIGSTLSAGGSAGLASGQPGTTPKAIQEHQSRLGRHARWEWYALGLLTGLLTGCLSRSPFIERRRSVWEHTVWEHTVWEHTQAREASLAGPG